MHLHLAVAMVMVKSFAIPRPGGEAAAGEGVAAATPPPEACESGEGPRRQKRIHLPALDELFALEHNSG